MDLGLKGRTALVLASSSGLGRGCAEALANEGVRVILTGRSEEKLAVAVAAIRAIGGEAESVVADLGSEGAAARIIDAAKLFSGSIDILVNNSGGPPPGLPSEISAESWSSHFDKMVLPIFEITRLAIGEMRARGWGRVITITSSGIVQPIPNLPISNALRLSIVGWMKSLAAEVAADGVTVNIVAPGRIATDRVRQMDRAAADKADRPVDEIERASKATIPVGRYGTIEEFASIVAFLAGAPASYVTGGILRVDGGLIRSL